MGFDPAIVGGYTFLPPNDAHCEHRRDQKSNVIGKRGKQLGLMSKSAGKD